MLFVIGGDNPGAEYSEDAFRIIREYQESKKKG